MVPLLSKVFKLWIENLDENLDLFNRFGTHRISLGITDKSSLLFCLGMQAFSQIHP